MTPEELANKMARHIIGTDLVPENEACQECIEIAREAILAERERCAKLTEAATNLLNEMDANPTGIECLYAANALRAALASSAAEGESK